MPLLASKIEEKKLRFAIQQWFLQTLVLRVIGTFYVWVQLLSIYTITKLFILFILNYKTGIAQLIRELDFRFFSNCKDMSLRLYKIILLIINQTGFHLVHNQNGIVCTIISFFIWNEVEIWSSECMIANKSRVNDPRLYKDTSGKNYIEIRFLHHF